MGEITGIAWTDSTMNFWEGCTKVGPGCDHCYAADRDARFYPGADTHWGPGAPRRQMGLHTRNNPGRWQKKAAEFMAEHGHPRRVFCSSLADIFDNEVPDDWRLEAFTTMRLTPDLRWQLCTKRVSNIAKMVPESWKLQAPPEGYTGELQFGWPSNVGILITVVTPEEVLRDVPRLTDLKRRFGIPWIGLSIEPMIADVTEALRELASLGILQQVDWAIFGGESGPDARDFYLMWMLNANLVCKGAGVAVFNKQLGARPFYAGGASIQLKDPAGKDPGEWPPTMGDMLRTREFPAALCS